MEWDREGLFQTVCPTFKGRVEHSEEGGKISFWSQRRREGEEIDLLCRSHEGAIHSSAIIPVNALVLCLDALFIRNYDYKTKVKHVNRTLENWPC